MKKKIFSSIFLVSIALIIIISTVVIACYNSVYSETRLKQLKEEAQLVIKGVELNGKSYFADMTLADYRITWIESDGTVLFESEPNTNLDNHLERKEVKQALETGYGESKRYSDTILKESIYVAYKINDGSVIRLSCTQNSVFYLVLSTLYPLFYVVFFASVLAIVLAYYLSKKIIDPLNKINLDKISTIKSYPEIEPLLNKIENQREQLIKDKNEIEKTALLRQEFTANVSHEMKTPLHVIAGYSELMKEGMVEGEKIKEFSSKIYLESYRMTKLVDDILELSKLDNGQLDEEKKLIPLDTIVENVIDSLEIIAEENNIQIHSRLEPVEILGSPNVIHSMVYNLIDNAIKYNKKNGRIDVIVEKEDNKSVLYITDTGIGISNEDKERIFERFYRVDKSHSRDIGGTGLGLSIVKHAAIIHNAKITVDSTLGEGTTFKLEF